MDDIPTFEGEPIPLPLLQYISAVLGFYNCVSPEHRIGRGADLWFALSPDHRALFHRIWPNGVDRSPFDVQ